jgi:pyruvate/2-oxoglutarate dehydrogenase complex dihydrolipoamide dehydrogenase (E3) component
VTAISDDGGTVTTDDLLAATGRAPVTEDLNSKAAGVEVNAAGFVVVDELRAQEQ